MLEQVKAAIKLKSTNEMYLVYIDDLSMLKTLVYCFPFTQIASLLKTKSLNFDFTSFTIQEYLCFTL